jgi:hypothetical protein
MSTRGRLTNLEQTLEALAGAVRALEARVEELEGASRPDSTPLAPSVTAIWAGDQVPARDRAVMQLGTGIGRLTDAVKQLQAIIEPDNPVPLEPPVLGLSAARDRAPRDRRKPPQVRRADEEFEKAAAAELAEHEAWLQNLRERLTGGWEPEDKDGSG